MIKTLGYLAKFRDWRTLLFAGAAGFCVFSVLAVAVATKVALADPTILLISTGGAVFGVFLGFVGCALRVIRKLNEQNARRDFALNNMAQGLSMFDGQHRLVVWNKNYETMYGLGATIRRGCKIRELLVARHAAGTLPLDPAQYEADLRAALDQGSMFTVDVEMPDGRVIAVVNQPTSEGGWVATHEDITDRKRAERELDNTRAFLDMIVENVPSPIIVKDAADLKYLLVNRATEEYFGVDRAKIIGKNSADMLPKALVQTIIAEDRGTIESGEISYQGEHGVITPGNGMRIVTATRLPVKDIDGKPKYLITVIHDITDRKRSEQRIAHLAHHDSTTDLPNRAAFNECIEATVDLAAKVKESFAVLCIDLDRFKAVNDVFGHPVGDALLGEVARRLEQVCQGAFVARVGGDEFTVITPTAKQPQAAEALAERLAAAFESDITIASHQMRVGLTIGVAIYPQDGADAATLVGNADAALFRAKSEARGSIRFFEVAMDQQLSAKRALQQDLRKAVEQGELALHYMPQANMDGQITGFEALARWHHPRHGLVPPDVFIPLAEESGIIGALGEWVLRTACLEAAAWPNRLHIAVNLSPVQFQHGDLPSLVHQVLLDTGLSPARLELEITEGVLIGDFARAVAMLRRLKNMGVRVAMDDFGTGYSSLSYLQSFPFDKIKIDRSFVANLSHSRQSATITRAVIALSRGLGVPVVAEGVETEAQRKFLAAEGCDAIQGYLVGRPMPIEEYARTVGRTPARPAIALVASA
ncbi:MAG: EAL domain-containing protein [Pseudolabrys sp.]|nr:EAL domain-containing protein [Pseudolabrys sp.]MDP2298853.1 EAL domain-containing protein [Pseudolabrys sp.]